MDRPFLGGLNALKTRGAARRALTSILYIDLQMLMMKNTEQEIDKTS